MRHLRDTLVLPMTFAICATIVLLGTDAMGRNHLRAPASRVATVDLSMLFERIETNATWEVELNTLAERLNSEATRRQEAIQRQLEQAQASTDPTEARAISDSAALMKLELDEWAQLKQIELDRERGLMWRAMYRSIREQAESLAKAESWDLVLINDSLGEVKFNANANISREQQVLSQILNRRMLYAGAATDITEQLIVRINNLKR